MPIRLPSPFLRRLLRGPLPSRPGAAGGLSSPARPRRIRPAPELLEDRTVPTDLPLAFDAFNTARVSGFLSPSETSDRFRVMLNVGDVITTHLQTTSPNGGLVGRISLHDAAGTTLARNDQEGGDPRLDFQAATAGEYLISVSGVDGSAGLYTLQTKRQGGVPLLPDLTGSLFRLGTDMAAVGETVPVSFAVENRGGADAGSFRVQILLADDNLFDNSSRILATLQRSDLTAAGRSFASPAGFDVTLPAGLAAGSAFIGLRIIADPAAAESDSTNNSGVFRGADWQPFTVVTAVPGGTTNLSAVDAGLRTGAGGVLAPGQSATYSFTITEALGNSRLTAHFAASGFPPG